MQILFTADNVSLSDNSLYHDCV